MHEYRLSEHWAQVVTGATHQSLRVLAIDGSGFEGRAFENMCAALRSCPNLELVFGWLDGHLYNDFLVNALAPLKKLRHIGFRNFQWKNEEAFMRFIEKNGGILRCLDVGDNLVNRRV